MLLDTYLSFLLNRKKSKMKINTYDCPGRLCSLVSMQERPGLSANKAALCGAVVLVWQRCSLLCLVFGGDFSSSWFQMFGKLSVCLL